MEKIIQLAGNTALTNKGNVYLWTNKLIQDGPYKGLNSPEMEWKLLPLPDFHTQQPIEGIIEES